MAQGTDRHPLATGPRCVILGISLHCSISAPLVSNLKDSVSVNFYVWKVDQRDIET